MRAILLIFILVFVPVAQLNANDYDFSPIKHILDGYVADKRLAGSVILVQKEGQTLFEYASGFQDLEQNKVMKPDSLFRIASMTKAITSVAIMMLQEQGKLSVSDPLSKFIPAFKHTEVAQQQSDGSVNIVPAKREIVLHDLLTHTAGISYGGQGSQQQLWRKHDLTNWYFANKNQTMLEAITPIAGVPQNAQPGEAFVYGFSTDILGVVIEIASGLSLQQFFQQHIFEPLAMTDSHFYLPAEKTSRLTAVYSATNFNIKRAPNVHPIYAEPASQGHYFDGPRKAFSGGAGLISSAQDYSKFLQMLLNGGVVNNKRILSEISIMTMLQNQIPYVDFLWSDRDSFGYSFVVERAQQGVDAGEVIKFSGGGAYHTSYFVRPKDKVTVVYLTQLLPANGLKDFDFIEAAIEVVLGVK